MNAGIKRHQSFKQPLNTVLECFGIYKWVRQGQNGLNFWKIFFYFRRVESNVKDRVSKKTSLQNKIKKKEVLLVKAVTQLNCNMCTTEPRPSL